ncbi:amino acid transporter AVT1C-like [Arachis stenosperma]|uniref:amino acid transporter AVT1C n=1 Tax=Arachis hypogaea TaxID=3818 RepID=UPI000DEC8D03|nr:amino acid transporter AVT1C [Arachis hypogaea]XP_025648314.1 amino acid transporter AVT1C [Arachis hypogaea]XP_025648318.1 amino acid transporter AVT1C [Arachis hypogaea]XP_057743687.1 amino acid transporter AVT1C-like [Arachis stenosperma]XP_057743688.1 amino acid transporter AVT1C-like [Arachis stenosperma]XP_057743689.1 amino acid transporter AVT1C-like [Arachis stenosperma]
MKNSVSDRSFYIESDDEDEEKDLNNVDQGNDSDDSHEWNDHDAMRKPSSYSMAWPQSYRQSIDLLGSVPSPNIGFLGTTSLSRLGSSFIVPPLIKRHPPVPDTIPSAKKPLLQPTDIDDQRRSSHILHPPHLLRGSTRNVISKVAHDHEVHFSGQCTFGQAVLNGINALCGVGILSTPYALKEGGWVALSVLFIFSAFSFYTGLLLRHCLDSEPGLETYPDIGQAAFGTSGRIFISVILYSELYACCIEYIILESDNLSSLFPNAHLSLGGLELNPHVLFAILTTLAILPTVYLRDLRILSYLSACGVLATTLVVLCLFWVGLIDNVGIHSKGTTINLATFPVAMGLYGYCYSGHAVFPNLYTAMANRNQFPAVLLVCFALCTVMYAAVAIMGYTMFGEYTLSQYTLNMPQGLVATKLAVWTTVVNPFTKYALSLTPVAKCLEELIPLNDPKFNLYSIFIRTMLVVSTLLVGLSVPFFGLVMSLIGSLLTMFVSLILPSACFLKIKWGKISQIQVALCVTVMIVAVVSSAFGSYSAISEIIEQLFG